MWFRSMFLSLLAAGCAPTQQPASETTQAAQTGWARGDLAPDVQVTDQFGDPLSVASLGGSLVLIDVTALWATVRSDVPEQTEALAQAHAADGLVYVTAVIEDVLGEPAERAEQLAWADEFGITGPVVGPSELWPDDLGAWLVDRDGTVLDEVRPYTAAGIDDAVVEAL